MIYISGPITGDAAAPMKFAAAEAWIKANFDQSVVNPEKIFRPLAAAPYDQLIESCCRLASKSEIIALLPRWEKSFGSCKELLSYLLASDYPIVQQLYLKTINGRLTVGWTEAIPEGNLPESYMLKDICRKRLARGRQLPRINPFIE